MVKADAIRPPVPAFSSELCSGDGQAAAASGSGLEVSTDSAVEEPSVQGDEVQKHRVLPTPHLPTQSERMAHRITHLPYRSWCPECVEAFAREQAHKASALSEREFPLVSVDYLFLSPKGVI